MPTAPAHPPDAPRLSLTALDQLWFQVSGTVCNLRCRHCFISCAPDNHAFWFMDRRQVAEALGRSVDLGVKEYYFTGGEPFMNAELEGMLADTLAIGPATVLTNGTLLPLRRVHELERIARGSPYTLELRVSLDGTCAEMNDPIRGPGTFDRAMEGVARLVTAGFLPIITTMQSWPDAESDAVLAGLRRALGRVGYDRPRLKILPPLLIGEEAKRTRSYDPPERVTHEMLHGFDLDQLLCTRGRLVTASGVYACPILLDVPEARLGDDLDGAVAAEVRLSQSACYTCYMGGAICANASSVAGDFS